MSRRDENVSIFNHSMSMCEKNETLKDAVVSSIEREKVILKRDRLPEYKEGNKAGNISVTSNSTFMEASMHAGKVCALNFANAFHPGGGVERGATAQEEALCRISTLYPCITAEKCMNGFYYPHKHNHRYTGYDDCIYTPDVIVFKEDDGTGRMLDEKNWYKCDVITCAAPNLREHPDFDDQKLYDMICDRTDRILEIAVMNHVDVLILGAFGCGAFACNPYAVSQAMMDESLRYRSSFEDIVFAIYATHSFDQNLEIFTESYNQIVVEGK